MAELLKKLAPLLIGGSNQKATQITKAGRILYISSATAIILGWYTAYRNERVAPGTFKFPFPGWKKLKAQYPPDRKDVEDEGWVAPHPTAEPGGFGNSKAPQVREGKSTDATIPQTPKEAKALAGVGTFDGHPVARWIIPYLNYARLRGWKGTVTSGYRSYQEQYRIYYIEGIRPAALPGTSNHEGKVFPKGAVDVSEAEELNRILTGIIGGSLLKWAGSADPVHFSYPHNGSY